MSDDAPPLLTHARLTAYAARLGVPAENLDAAAATDSALALAAARAALLGCAPDSAAWISTVLAREGIAADPRRPLFAQVLAVERTPMAARPFRRPTLRRLLTGLLRPLGALGRRVQPLADRVAE